MNSKLLFISTYPPRECGIATFTADLVNAIKNQMDDSIEIEICALKDGIQGFNYPKEVKYVLDTRHPAQYFEIAQKINDDHQVKAVMIEHEFGLYGGEYGDYIFNILDILKKPSIITFHTVLTQPDAKRLKTVRALADKANRLLVMTNNSKEILISNYKLSEEKIKVIPHGTHLVLWKRKEKAKNKFGLSHRPILATFGLLGGTRVLKQLLMLYQKSKNIFLMSSISFWGKPIPVWSSTRVKNTGSFLKTELNNLA